MVICKAAPPSQWPKLNTNPETNAFCLPSIQVPTISSCTNERVERTNATAEDLVLATTRVQQEVGGHDPLAGTCNVSPDCISRHT